MKVIIIWLLIALILMIRTQGMDYKDDLLNDIIFNKDDAIPIEERIKAKLSLLKK